MSDKDLNFNQQCYELLKMIPKGKVTTYAEIAKALNTRAYRAVGNAMARNKHLISIPCHRVVRSNGEIGQFALGTEKKCELLSGEGLKISNGKIIDLHKVLFTFN